MQMSTMELTPDTTVEQIKNRLHHTTRERARSSDQRRQYLEKVARILSKKDVELRLDDGSPRCTADTDKDAIIFIPYTETEQPVTNLRGIHWDLLFQETELMHELGHVLYTDFSVFESEEYDVKGRKSNFRQFFNAAEDGAIETQLARRYNVGDDLTLKNANLSERNIQLKEEHQPTGEIRYSLFEAVCKGCLDMGYYDSGEFSEIIAGNRVITGNEDGLQILRDLQEPLADFMSEFLSTSNGRARIELAVDFWNEHLAGLNDTDRTSPPMDMDVDTRGPNNDPEDADELGDGDEHVQQSSASPDNEEEEDGTGGSGEEDEEGDENGDNGGNSEDKDGDDEEGNGSGSGSDGEEDDDSEDESDVGPATPDDLEQAEDDMEEKYREEVNNEQSGSGDGDETEQEAEELLKVVQSGAGSGADVHIETPNDQNGDWDTTRYNESKKTGDRVKNLLERQLQRERATETRRGERFGRLDNQKMMDGKRGNPRIWTQKNNPGDKDYSYVILLDRSGSMDNINKMSQAEIAAGTFAHALSEVGANVSIMSFYGARDGDHVDIELPFGSDLQTNRKQVFSGNNHGGTPTSDALEIAAERVSNMDGQSCIITITDGAPNDGDRYMRTLESTNVPVWGVYIDGKVNHSQYFDHFVNASAGDVVSKIQQLSREVVL